MLLVGSTRSNRATVTAARDELASEFPTPTRRAMRHLEVGRDPGADCLIPSSRGSGDFRDAGRNDRACGDGPSCGT